MWCAQECIYRVIRIQYRDNDEIDRMLFQTHTRAPSSMMEQWRIKRYDITVMASHRQFTAEKAATITRKEKKIAETLCVLFLLTSFYAQRSRCFYINNPCALFVSFFLLSHTRSLSLSVLFARTLYFHLKFQINLFVSLHPPKRMNCHNECKINWLLWDSIIHYT